MSTYLTSSSKLQRKQNIVRIAQDKLTTNSDQVHATRQRLPSAYNPLQSYVLPRGDQKQYQQQYADIYFLRLATLKPAVDQLAEEAWADFQVQI